MGKYEKLLRQVVEGGSDANIGFDDLCTLLSRMGWSERIRGSHHVFSKENVEAQLNLQRQGSNAKAYQVKQVRRVLLQHGLAQSSEEAGD